MSPAPLRPVRSRRSFLGLAAGVGAALALPGCGGDGEETASTGSAQRQEVTLTTCVYAKNHASAPLFWQRFAPEGVTVDVKIITSSAEVQQGLESGALDFGLMGVYNTILAQEQGINSKIIGMVARQGIGLIGRVGRVATVADLRGKKVAVPPPGVQVLILTELLGRAGLALGKEVQGVPLGYADHPAALSRGDVDAYIGTEPLATQSVLAGVGVRLPEVYDTPLGDFNTALWASPEMLESPELTRLGASLQRQAAEYLTPGGVNDRAAWRDLLVTQFGYEEPVYERVLDNVGAEWRFDQKRADQFAGAGATLLRQNVITRQPDYEAFYARDYWLP